MRCSLCLLILSGLTVLSVSACVSDSIRIHPRYRELQPSAVRLAPVENRTLRSDLDNYTTARLLQRAVFGRGAVNIPDVLEREAREAVGTHGYTILDGTGNPEDVVGELRLRILSWSDVPSLSGGGVEGEYEVELVRLDTGESLFVRRCFCRTTRQRGSGSVVTASELERTIRSSVSRCLSKLPPSNPPGQER